MNIRSAGLESHGHAGQQAAAYWNENGVEGIVVRISSAPAPRPATISASALNQENCRTEAIGIPDFR
ncbi:hypothetical protein [Arboricoccus pini]|uniref:hypothetical protein n=1 Tax=Arboricoccus pini TaxID=1963835 RepID=UPI000B50294D|nr:hypothetical protein [Arboricoccus pini]